MSKRLLERQAQAKKDAQKGSQLLADLGKNKPIHELWLQSDMKKKTSEVNKIKERSTSSAFDALVMPTIPSITVNPPVNTGALDLDRAPLFEPLILSPNPNLIPVMQEKIPSIVLDGLMPQLRTATQTPVANTQIHPYADILVLSPNMSSPGSARSPFQEQIGNLFAQLQIRRSRPEHSPSLLSPNFSPGFSPRFVPTTQFRPKTLMDYLQNFGQNGASFEQQNREKQQRESKKAHSVFFARVFGNNPPAPPQFPQFGKENVDGAVSTTVDLSQCTTSHQITNTLNNFPGGAVVMRTVHQSPDGSTVTNTRVLSLNNLLDQNEGFGNLDNEGPQIFGSILETLSGLQGANMFAFSNTSAYVQDRNFDKKAIQNMPAITYEAEKFKDVPCEGKKCAICSESLKEGEEIKDLFCVHKFHKQCVDEWPSERFNCPSCQSDNAKSEKAAAE